jgi:hypothetical protein
MSQELGGTVSIKLYATRAELSKLYASGVTFEHGFYDEEAFTYTNTFAFEEVQKIKSLGYKFDVLIPDMVAYIDSINRVEPEDKYAGLPLKEKPKFQALTTNFDATCQTYDSYVTIPAYWTKGSMGGFYNLSELDAQLQDMANKYPGIVSRGTIGNSLQGRPIWYVKISDNAATDEAEPEVLYTGMHHSREGMSMMNLIFFMRFILEKYTAGDAAIKEIIENRELFFIPAVNIDGFNYNTTATNWNAGRRFRRKNMAETTTNAQNANGSGGDGVDVNRNYGTYWGPTYATTSSGQMGSTGPTEGGHLDTYRGSAAFSEIETQRMKTFIDARNFKVALNYHCYGNWWIRASGPDDVTHPTTALSAANVATYNSIANLFTKYNCYVYGTPKQTVYPVNGYSDDYLFSGSTKSPVFSFSPEIGTDADGFWCPTNKIEVYAKELVYPNLQAAYTAGSYAELQDVSDVAVNTTSASFNFTVVRKGLVDGPVTITLVPISGIGSVANPTYTINSIPSFGGIVTGSIGYTLPSNMPEGAVIQFKWVLQTGGITISETVIKVYKPQEVFKDDMETAATFGTKWSKGTGAQWAYNASTGYGNTASLTESPGVNYGINANHTIKLANALDLSVATKAYLSFLTKFSTEQCRDRLQIEISTTGVNGTYVPICGKNTISENRGDLAGTPALTGNTDGWIRETIDLSSYAGNNNIGLQFRFLSSGSNKPAYTPDGFYIDNINVIKTGNVILPVHFEDLVATRRNDVVHLNWKAHFEGNFSHFVVERSTDGRNFLKIGEVADSASKHFQDQSPLRANNYYRIKAVDADGSFRYSKTVLVVFEPEQMIAAYPNPTPDQFTLEVVSTEQQLAFVELYGMDGKRILHQQVLLKKGSTKHLITLASLPSQVYLVHVRDAKGVIMQSFKLIKK